MSTIAQPVIDRDLVERMVRQVVYDRFAGKAAASSQQSAAYNPRLLVNISARHVHVTQEHLEVLFGAGTKLTSFITMDKIGMSIISCLTSARKSLGML